MLKVQSKGGSVKPVLICDACKGPIIDPGLAMVAYPDSLTEGAIGEPAFLHKGRCDDAYREGQNRLGGWSELQDFLADVCIAAGMTENAMFLRISQRTPRPDDDVEDDEEEALSD